MSNIGTLNRMFANQMHRLAIRLKRAQVFLIAGALCLVSGLTGAIAFPTVVFASNIASPAAIEQIAPLAEGADIAADKVDQFAIAYLQVLKLLSDREPELPAAETSAEAVKVQQAIEADAVKLIESSGLTMPEYMKMLGLASQDATFRDKVLSRIDASIEE